jgi:hypothetical protein
MAGGTPETFDDVLVHGVVAGRTRSPKSVGSGLSPGVQVPLQRPGENRSQHWKQ